MENILVVEDTDSLREVLCMVLSAEGYQVKGAASAEEGLVYFAEDDFTLVLSDLKLPNKSGLEFLKESRVINNLVPVIVMTAYGSIDVAVQAMKLGATDFITKPFDPEMLCSLIAQVFKHRRIVDRNPSVKRDRIITQSPLMEAVLDQVRKAAPLSTPVLLLGESGTGKELIARMIHELSPRKDNEFVAINCASMPGDLLESEFFGHEPGSFTGASERRIGLFEAADKGTIFLDEIGNMPRELQVKLLRTLQESEIKRLGSNVVRKVDSRVISATNCKIEERVKSGEFRDDLYYRLGVLVVDIPPLRQRTGDVTLLAKYFVKCMARDLNCDSLTITEDALNILENYDWPGNVRELKNVIERAAIFADGPLTPESFSLTKHYSPEKSENSPSLLQISNIAQQQAEIEAILAAMNKAKGNKSKAARFLGVSYKTLLNKIKEYQLAPSDPRTNQ